jgi:hypothetical protein
MAQPDENLEKYVCNFLLFSYRLCNLETEFVTKSQTGNKGLQNLCVAIIGLMPSFIADKFVV